MHPIEHSDPAQLGISVSNGDTDKNEQNPGLYKGQVIDDSEELL